MLWLALLRTVFICFCLFFYTAQSSACHAGTLVFTGQAFVPIEKLASNHPVLSLDNNGAYYNNLIKLHARSQEKVAVIQLEFADNEKVCIAEHQKFFLNTRNSWIAARHLCVSDSVMRIDGSPCEIVSIRKLSGLHTVYHIDIGEPHTFFISRLCIMTHNMEFANTHALSLSITSGLIAAGGSTLSTIFATAMASPLLPVAAATAGSIALGAAVFFACKASKRSSYNTTLARDQVTQALKNAGITSTESCHDQASHTYGTHVIDDNGIITYKYDNPNQEIIETYKKELKCYKPCTCPCHHPRRSPSEGECNSRECSKKHNGNLYEANPAHPNNGTRDGYKSPGLNNEAGQIMLDRAIMVDLAGRTMVAAFDKIIAVFKLTRKDTIQNKKIYHGYFSSWNELVDDVKKALQEAGIANHKGKLLPQLKCIDGNKEPPKTGYCCACKAITR